MPRKIVICPSFAESHLIKCHIANMIQTINPDVIIYNEGLFPEGPENKGHIDEEFRKKWCYGDTNKGFDFDTTLELTRKYRTNGDICPNVVVLDCNYEQLGITDANQAYLYAISKFEKYSCYEPQVGDLIFPLEPDAFIFEGDMKEIEWDIATLNPGQGLSCRWVDFLETQFYTEAINIVQPKYRRFVYCFDNMENYTKTMDGFMSQDYPYLKKTDKFFIRHYCWFRPDPWKQLRYELIYRSNPQYWQDFEKGLQKIREHSEQIVRMVDPQPFGYFNKEVGYEIKDKILIRPSRQDEGRWAKFIDVPHPKAIESHPNFVK